MSVKLIHTVQYLVLHHTAANKNTTTVADLIAERERRNEGYNKIIEERDGVVTVTQDVPDGYISNGTYGLNQISQAIAVNDNFEINVPSDAVVEKVIQVLATMAKRLGWRKGMSHMIIGHQQAGKISAEKYGTACPGKHMIAKIPYIRGRVEAYLND